MKWTLGRWTLELKRYEPIIPIRTGHLLDELHLDAAFAVAESNSLFMAACQLIRTAEENAHIKSGQFISEPNRVFAEIGAAEICNALGSDFHNRRERGLNALRFVKPVQRRMHVRPSGDQE